MTRVLNIISDTNIGGAGRVILNYLRHADTAQFETHVAVPRGSLLGPELAALGAPVHEVYGIADRSYARGDVAVLHSCIERVGPDLVHTHGSLSGRIAAKRCGVPVVYSRHSAFPVPAKLRYPPGRWLNRWINEHYADHIIAVSPATAENLTDAGVSPKKITVVLNGVSPLSPLPPDERAALRAQLGLAPEDFTLGILARIEDYKGHTTIVEAARLLHERGVPVKILIAGTGSFADELAAHVVRAEVEHSVLLLGFRSDVAGILSCLDCQLNASYGTEATSIALLEGMSLGLPSIVSDYGGNPSVIEAERTGLVFPAQDAQALADCIARLAGDRALCARMSDAARESFETRFTGEIFARNTEKIYRHVLKGDPL